MIFPRVMKFEWPFICAREVGYHIRVRRILLRIRIYILFMVLLSETCQVVIDSPPLNPVREYLKRKRAEFSRAFPPCSFSEASFSLNKYFKTHRREFSK